MLKSRVVDVEVVGIIATWSFALLVGSHPDVSCLDTLDLAIGIPGVILCLLAFVLISRWSLLMTIDTGSALVLALFAGSGSLLFTF